MDWYNLFVCLISFSLSYCLSCNNFKFYKIFTCFNLRCYYSCCQWLACSFKRSVLIDSCSFFVFISLYVSSFLWDSSTLRMLYCSYLVYWDLALRSTTDLRFMSFTRLSSYLRRTISSLSSFLRLTIWFNCICSSYIFLFKVSWFSLVSETVILLSIIYRLMVSKAKDVSW